MPEKIITVPIYDKSGKFIGNVTGRREQVQGYSNRDLAEQIKRDNDRNKDERR